MRVISRLITDREQIICAEPSPFSLCLANVVVLLASNVFGIKMLHHAETISKDDDANGSQAIGTLCLRLAEDEMDPLYWFQYRSAQWHWEGNMPYHTGPGFRP